MYYHHCDLINNVAFDLSKLWRTLTVNRLLITCKMLWPWASKNYGGERQHQMAICAFNLATVGQSFIAL